MSRVKIKMTRAVQRAVDRAAPKTLNEAGRYVWRIARGLIASRKNPNIASSPGMAPYSHAGRLRSGSFNKGFKKTIVYGMDGHSKVVIGPMLVRGGLSNIARIHEFGGSRRVVKVVPELIDGVKVGDEGPVTVKNCTSHDVVIRVDHNVDPCTKRKVVWIKIRTKSQAEHSTRLYRRMNKRYGKQVTVNYPQRPYMKPALRLGQPKLSQFWINAVR